MAATRVLSTRRLYVRCRDLGFGIRGGGDSRPGIRGTADKRKAADPPGPAAVEQSRRDLSAEARRAKADRLTTLAPSSDEQAPLAPPPARPLSQPSRARRPLSDAMPP